MYNNNSETIMNVKERYRENDQSVNAYLEKIQERFESTEHSISAFLEEKKRWERLNDAADTIEHRFPDLGSRPALFGVPVGVKDIFHVEGFKTRAGSDVPPDVLSGSEATTVTALKDAGALILGKTVTTEFAYFEPGPTRNPHNPDHTPGGSSSGSAAAVAAGLCPLALGSQTIGSINRPAAFCGVVGVKPSYGRIPIEGVLPVAPSVDHVGFFTQDVPDAQLAAGVLYDDWRAEDQSVTTRPTIGAVDGPYLEQVSQTGRDHFESHINCLKAAGYNVHRIDPFPNIKEINRRHDQLVAAETALSHAEWYPEYRDQYSETTIDLIEEGHDVDIETLSVARAGRLTLRDAVHDTMDERDLDVIISPSAPGPAPEGLNTTGDPVMNLPWTHSGLPTLTLPASKTDNGLPIGLQCTARYGYDEWLLTWCEDLHKALLS